VRQLFLNKTWHSEEDMKKFFYKTFIRIKLKKINFEEQPLLRITTGA
jgi:hypothetical protein